MDLNNNFIKDLITVIVPVYNVEKYLEQCVNSILNQTYKNIEIILVDDGSKDKSGQLCNEFSNKYSQIKTIHKKNAGLGMARNSGLKIANGEYIAFVDSDDWLAPQALKNLYDSMTKFNCDYCKGGFQKVNDEGHVLFENINDFQLFEGTDAKRKLLPRLFGSAPGKHDSINMSVWGCLFKHQIIMKHNLRFPSERKLMSEDIVFDIDYMQYVKNACIISKSDYKYRQNAFSLSTSYREDKFIATKKLYKYLLNKMKALDYGESTILRIDRNLFVNLSGCIFQENNRSLREARKRINIICTDPEIRSVIKKYPRKKLGLKQRIFLSLILRKQVYLLYLLAKVIN